MGWKFCSACGFQYNDAIGGCTNSSCPLSHKSVVQRQATKPRPPQNQTQLNQQATAVKTVVSKAPSSSGPSKPTTATVGSRPSAPALRAAPLTSVGGPAAVASNTPAPSLAGNPTGAFVVFRGDTRSPAAIRTANGFFPWGRPNSLDQCRGLISRLTTHSNDDNFAFSLEKSGGKQHPFETTLKTPMIHQVTKKSVPKTLLNLSKYIIGMGSGQNYDAFHVSTAPSVDCGGYGNQGYIYRIEFTRPFHFFDQSGTSVGLNAAQKGKDLVMLDHPNIGQAQFIGLVIGGSPGGTGTSAYPDIVEVSFLRPIPLSQITAYQPKGGQWYAM